MPRFNVLLTSTLRYQQCRCFRSAGQNNKKLNCRREIARRFVSLNILLGHSRSLKVIQNDTVM